MWRLGVLAFQVKWLGDELSGEAAESRRGWSERYYECL